MEREDFYRHLAEILERPHQAPSKFRKRTRWNHREPGPGRFEGWGVIRWFSPTAIHATLQWPRLETRTFASTSEAFAHLTRIIETDGRPPG